MTSSQRLAQQIAFIVEIDKLKHIQRQTILLDRSRRENDAEHSWHLALMVMLLAEYSNKPIDCLRVIKMVLVHDLVEIDAGDTYAYDEDAHHDKVEREQAAAERLFGMLPADQGRELRGLWDEFEDQQTADARFAGAVDRMQPLLHNCLTEGETWLENDVKRSQVIRRCQPIELGSERLWDYMLAQVEQAVAEGHLGVG
jgi:5'-deoxynucleotidase YfbR-like HD superfamily hydrolase